VQDAPEAGSGDADTVDASDDADTDESAPAAADTEPAAGS
jgi:hypothetical protein